MTPPRTPPNPGSAGRRSHGAVQGLALGLVLAAWALAWLLGVAWQLRQTGLVGRVAGIDGHAAAAVLALSIAGAAFGCWHVRAQRAAITGLAVALGLAGWAMTGWRASERLADRLSPALEGVDLVVIGRVDALPRRSADGVRFTLAVESAARRSADGALLAQDGLGGHLPERLALGWMLWPSRPGSRPARAGHGDAMDPDAAVQDTADRGAAAPEIQAASEPVIQPADSADGEVSGADLAASGPAPEPAEPHPLLLKAGDRWRFEVRLKQVHGLANPHAFDAELWWFAQGVGASGHVRHGRAATTPQRLQAVPGWPSPAWALLRWREQIRQRMADAVPDVRQAGVLAALVVGDQAAIDRTDWDLFRRSGVAHLMAISGVHVTMFAWLAAAILRRLWCRLPPLALALPTPVAARWGGLLLAAAYAGLAGWGVPAQRTVLMLGLAVLLRSGRARWPWPLVLLTAAVAVTALDPWALLQPGFWLSFAAVGLLMASEPASGRALPVGWRARLAGHGRGQWLASIGLAPLSLLFFQQVSVVGLLANLAAIPWVTLLVTPLALVGVFWPPVWALAAWAVAQLVIALEWLAGAGWAVWHAPAPPDWAWLPAAIGTVLAVLPLPWRARALALPLVLPLLWPWPDRPASGEFELLAVDVGQGTAVLLRTRGHLLVYDAGPAYVGGGDAGDRVLAPLLRARGERRIDRLVVSHRDNDHAGGAAALMAQWPVGELLSGLTAGHPLHGAGVPWRSCRSGQRWTWDGVDFEVLHPQTGPPPPDFKPSNAASCVLRVVDAQGRSALLTGDIEAAQEQDLLRRAAPALRADVVLVPHHGSRTSSRPEFVAAVGARWAVVQAGYRSRYGHPAPDIEARWGRSGAKVVRTDQCGAWRWRGGETECHRVVYRRHWHWSPPVGQY